MPDDQLLRLLLIEGNPADARWLEDQLRHSGPAWCTLSHATTLAAATEMVRAGGVDAVLLDLSLPDAAGVEAVKRMHLAAPQIPLVVLTRLDDEQAALEAVKQGAQDYLTKDQVTGPLLARAIRYAVERKRADESQRREAAATQTAKLREQFVAVLSHDLRNPLSSIAISAGLLLKNADLTERQLRTVARIASSADRMNRMIRDLLDFTRARLGDGYTLSPRPASLRDVLQQVVNELEIVHHDRSLIVVAEQRCVGNWDVDRMAQVAANLISNGLQYSAPETPVRIALREDAFETVLEVTNQGSPIPPDRLPALFEPFHRVQAHPDGAVAQGLGLGLYIAYQIVLAHRGRIDVRSVPGEGTTFSVRLPRTPSPPV